MNEQVKMAWLLIRHYKSYHCRERLRELGGSWDRSTRAWRMPDQHAYQEGLKCCSRLSGQASADTGTTTVALYTERQDRPVNQGGIVALERGAGAVESYEVQELTTSDWFSGPAVDFTTKKKIQQGYRWEYEARYITGQERQRLLS